MLTDHSLEQKHKTSTSNGKQSSLYLGAPQFCCTESCHCEIKATQILKVLWKLVRSKMREDYTACGVGVALRECNKCENERHWRYSVIWSPLFTLLSSCHRLHHRFHRKLCFCQLEAQCHPATCHLSVLISRTLVVCISFFETIIITISAVGGRRRRKTRRRTSTRLSRTYLPFVMPSIIRRRCG